MDISDPGKYAMGDLETFLKWEKTDLDMVVLSGGGNDIAGLEDLSEIMQVGDQTDPKSWFEPQSFDDRFDAIQMGLERAAYLCTLFSPGVPILAHCYDYAHASGKSLLWFSAWLKPAFDRFGVPDELRSDVVRVMINELAARNVRIANKAEHYHFIDTRGTLKTSDWANELHPNKGGFNKIAKRFYLDFERHLDGVEEPNWF